MPFRKLGEPLFSLGMGQRLGLGNRNSGASLEYWQNLQALFGSSIIAYYPMWDLTGTVMTDIQNGRNGAYQGNNGVTLNQPPLHGNKPSVFVTTINSWCNVNNAAALAALSTALAAGWSIMFDYQPLAAANWTDGTDHWLFRFSVDANNLVQVYKPNSATYLIFEYTAGGTTVQRIKTGLDGSIIHCAITGSKADDRVRAYIAGVQQGANLTGLGNWAGVLNSASIGEYIPSNGVGAGAKGYFQNFLILSKEATPAEVASVNSFSLPAVTPPEAGGFTIIFIPDTQALVQTPAYRAGFTEMMNWIVSNKASLNIAAVVTEGDVVETLGIADEWVAADASYGVLDADGTIPYLVAAGDHDYDNIATHDATTFNTYFPTTRYSGQSWWAGNFQAAGHSENAYNIVTIDGTDYLFIQIEPRPIIGAASLTWLDNLLTTHASKKAIITTHDYLDSDNLRSAYGDRIWNVVKLHDNVIWISCGNYVSPDGYGRLTSQTDGGKDVHQVLFDTQSEPYGGPWLRVVKFNPGNNIVTETYSPVSRLKMTDNNNEFTLNFPS